MGNGEEGSGAISHFCYSTITQSHMGATRDHETRRLAERRSAAGMPRQRFDLKVAVALHCPFPVPHSPTCDLRQTPPRHSNLRFSASPATRTGLRPTRISTNEPMQNLFPRCVFLDRINRIYKILAVCKCFGDFIIL